MIRIIEISNQPQWFPYLFIIHQNKKTLHFLQNEGFYNFLTSVKGLFSTSSQPPSL